MSGKPTGMTQTGRRRTIWCEDELWNELLRVAAERSQKEDAHVSVSELFRRGVRRELIAHLQTGWYRRPPHLRAIVRAWREGQEDKIRELRKHAPNS